ncbi:phosphatidylinositol 4-5-bisphosphate 3-kinase catalytic subunit beta isoform, partial [Brachionus plicatilis]
MCLVIIKCYRFFSSRDILLNGVMAISSISSIFFSIFLSRLDLAIKNEPYLRNDLSKFILKRAFESSKIGNKLFWILKTEATDT